jgi:DNA-binding CsgD family transcriptional regulator
MTEAHDLPVGVGLGPATLMSPQSVQAVLDAAALLQVRRSEAAALAARGELTEGQIVAVGLSAAHEWLHSENHDWHENLSVRPTASVTQLRAGLPVNRARVAAGMRMVSVFDYTGLDSVARLLLANEPTGDYLFGRAPVQMKIIDRRFAVLDGPIIDGGMSLMTIYQGPCLAAAWRYWDAVIATCVPPEEVTGPSAFTARQLQVVALLMSDLADDAIAASLGVSVRTIRSDVAAIMKAVGVKSRFAAGARLQFWASQGS